MEPSGKKTDKAFSMWRFVVPSAILVLAALAMAAPRYFIPGVQVYNEGSAKRPGWLQASKWDGVTGAARQMSDPNGGAESFINNQTDQTLCIKALDRTSAAAPSCAVSYPAGVCVLDHYRLAAAQSLPFLVPYSDQNQAFGIFCGTMAAAVTNGEHVYLLQLNSTVAQLGASTCGGQTNVCTLGAQCCSGVCTSGSCQ